ncbi:V-type proton ATPase subunit e-like [Trichoplusia ni]|uniref:V-type proton ATPase subunit e-like n=1 Tax=Trichoplusia ni TaxID=7111 RepID=A0A7E5VBL6_TRINI|nr:V-type proton ATPase subunit e-like [Trichoplusia ni]
MSYTPNYPTVSVSPQMPEPGAKTITKEQKTYYSPIYMISALFIAIFVIGPLFVRQGPNTAVTRCCIMLSAVMLWLFWVTMYIAQMNPMMGPRLENVTAAWLGHVWGKHPKSIDNEL